MLDKILNEFRSLKTGEWVWGVLIVGIPASVAFLVLTFDQFGLGLIFCSLFVASVVSEGVFVEKKIVRLGYDLFMMIGVALIGYFRYFLSAGLSYFGEFFDFFVLPFVLPILLVWILRGLVKIFKKPSSPA